MAPALIGCTTVTDRREYNKAWRAANRDKVRAYVKANREKINAWQRDWRSSQAFNVPPEKLAARNAVMKAITAGKIKRPETCETCGGNGLIHGHHDDYSKKLEVRWLCAPCHGVTHRVHP